MRPGFVVILSLLALASVHAPARAAAASAVHPGAAAALGAAPAPPQNYSVDMKVHADGKDFMMTRWTNENGDTRMDIATPDQGNMTMIQLNDEKHTMYTVMAERKEVMKQTGKGAEEQLEKARKKAPKVEAPKDSAKADDGTIALVGQEKVNGITADKYKVSSEGMDGFLWIDPTTNLVSRMQAENGIVDFTNYKMGATTPEALTPPKDYQLTDIDEMMAKMGSMGGGMAGMGGGAKGMMSGMGAGMGSSLGGSLGGQAGGALGGMIGGPLGRMAGTYLGKKLGSKLGAKAGSKL